MITFVLSLIALVVGYLVYGRIVERVFAPDDRPTPAVSMADGVDYVVLPGWKIFMIQFLNIAGTGPIFGAIMGAKFGPSAYLWIVLGCIFAGAVHDYLSGMLSMRHKGAGLPELVGAYLGGRTKKVMLVFSVFLLLMVGAVFVYSPAIILGKLCSDSLSWVYIWCLIIFAYYFLATMLPIDKIIGRIYPIFAIAMLFMAVALMAVLFVKWPSLPELTDGLSNMNPSSGTIFPCLFITIACGAISGFHATQSPLMARCIKSERQGRPLFYGRHAPSPRSRYNGLTRLAGSIRRGFGDIGSSSRPDYQRRHCPAERAAHHRRVPAFGATLHPQAHLYLHPRIRSHLGIVVV